MHFVISAPRSGSTWLTRALNAHPQVFATEHRLFGEFCEIWPNNDGTQSPRITFDEFAKAFAVHYFYGELNLEYQSFVEQMQRTFHQTIVQFASERNKCDVIVDKITPYPGTTDQVVDKIKRFFPEAKIIHLTRDGRDMVVSAAYDWLLKDAHGTDRFRYFVDQEKGVSLKRFFDDATLEHWARLWNEVNVSIGKLSDQTLMVRYEEMKTNLAGQLTRIANFLDISTEPNLIDCCVKATSFKKLTGRDVGNTDPTAKTRKGVVGDWKEHFTIQDAELFHTVAGNALIEFGYESEATWWQSCPKELSFPAISNAG